MEAPRKSEEARGEPKKTADSSVQPLSGFQEDGEPGLEAEEAAAAINIPWTFKWVALACVITFPMGQNWTTAAIGPLKNTLRNELGINNTQFGVISSADSFINSIFPIFGGLLLDWWGPNTITCCCTFLIFLGSVIAAVATNLNMWRVLVSGHVIMGFGVAVLDMAQQKFLYHWFGASDFAFVYGLENAVSATVGMVSGMTAIPIRDRTGWYGWSFWVPAILCGFSFMMNILYVLFERRVVPKKYRLTPARDKAISESKLSHKQIFSFKILFAMPWAYLLLPGTQILQSGAANGFGISSADIIYKKGYTEEVAGYLSTASKILRIVLSPFIGLFIDRYGHRPHFIATAPVFYVAAMAILGFSDVHPLVALVLSSLAAVINGLPLNVCIPLLVRDQAKLGTAFGIWRCFNNSGGVIMDVVYGIVQDHTPGQGYSRVLSLAIGLKSWGFCLGLIYILADRKLLGKGMTMVRKQRLAKEEQIADPDTDPLTRRRPKTWVTAYTLGILCCMIASSWGLFIRYLI